MKFPAIIIEAPCKECGIAIFSTLPISDPICSDCEGIGKTSQEFFEEREHHG